MNPGLSPIARRLWRRGLIAGALLALSAIFVNAMLWWLWPAFRAQAIGAMLWTGARVQPHRLPALQRTLDPWVPRHSILVIGDSFAGMLPTRWVGPQAVNFGIGGATTEHVREQLRDLQSPGAARALVILVGSNDLVHRSIPAAEADL